MATVAEIQAQLDAAGTGMEINIIRSAKVDATYDEHYCICLADAAAGPGVARWVRTTSANNAATQAATIVTGLTV